MNTSNTSNTPLKSLSIHSPTSTIASEAISKTPPSTSSNNNNNNNNNNRKNNSKNRSRVVNHPQPNFRKPMLNAIRLISLKPDPTCRDSLEQASLFVDLAAFDPKPGMDDFTNLYVASAVKDCYKKVEYILKGESSTSEKILDTNGILRTMLEYAVFKFKIGKHRATLFQGVLDIVRRRTERIGHAKGDSRMRHDVRAWMRYVTGKGPNPVTRRHRYNRKRTTRKVGHGV